MPDNDVIRAAGAVLWRTAPDGVDRPEIALVHRPHHRGVAGHIDEHAGAAGERGHGVVRDDLVVVPDPLQQGDVGR